jgi:2-oxoglutarate dehydrogenase E1 component
MHITDLEMRHWLQERMEVTGNRKVLSPAEQRRILKKLAGAVLLESFIQKKYLGAKSFSLEGAESLIPLLDMAIEKAGSQGTREVVLGMAHRGRLNVLTNILGKHPMDIFREFEDVDPEEYYGRGDVKYHMGHSSDWTTVDGRRVHLSLCFNPSHLEFINPVVLGRVRAKQDREGDFERRKALPLLIHGDAAFAGEGIVQETLNLSQLDAYDVGGALHVVLNNQIGFTTGPHQARSNRYATDIAKMLEIPIFHVNGEDPEAVAHVVDMSLEFRYKYQRDVVIDMYCYRRRGHNEGDEPAFTQPLLYKKIRARRDVSARYLDHLLELGGITRDEAGELFEEEEQHLEKALTSARELKEKTKPQAYEGIWVGYNGGLDADTPRSDTSITEEQLETLLTDLTRLPADFQPNKKIARLLEARQAMARGEAPLDWAAAEALALASLAVSGARIRMTGQDVERGTFSHRHAVLHDSETGRLFSPLAHLSEDQAPVEIANSPLSEMGVLGFEWGYSLDCPDGLVIWEAQFGDFFNAAQVIVDQFISSAEDKWHRLSGLTMLLPHGFEGQGPEHSSARLERWLQIAAEDNMQIAYPTTPGQFFHLLRRQVVRPIRKPLIVMSPKSLLRHPDVVSEHRIFTKGTFKRVIPDRMLHKKSNAKKILLCSGKIYYELIERARQLKPRSVAVIRLEQPYPLPEAELEKALAGYPKNLPVTWVQEEPRNMGAWPYLRLNFGDRLMGRRFQGVYRDDSASPATGSSSSHRIEQQELIEQAFARR